MRRATGKRMKCALLRKVLQLELANYVRVIVRSNHKLLSPLEQPLAPCQVLVPRIPIADAEEIVMYLDGTYRMHSGQLLSRWTHAAPPCVENGHEAC
jgi:hypothetical protein